MKTLLTKAWLLAVALLLAACGSAGGGHHGDESGGGGHSQMDHSQMGHGSMGMGSEGMARQRVMENGKYSDKRFIDSMVPHHQGAIEMARIALKNAEHAEIKQLSRNIVSTQQAEIKELKAIKEEEFGTSNVPMEMRPGQMRAMGMMMNPEHLARSDPFDRAFINAMIPHHQSAIDMAQVAYRQSDIPKIRTLAEDIIEAQAREITQMEGWRQQWYPQG